MARPVVGEMEMHSVANLATLQTPLANFFPSKKCPNLVSENHRYCASARSCSPSTRTHLSLSLSLRLLSFSPSTRTHLSLSLSLCVCSVSLPARAHTSLSLSLFLSLHLLSFCTARGREEQRFNSVKHRYYVASLI